MHNVPDVHALRDKLWTDGVTPNGVFGLKHGIVAYRDFLFMGLFRELVTDRGCAAIRSSTLSPTDRRSGNDSTVIRVPSMTSLPIMTLGSVTISTKGRSSFDGCAIEGASRVVRGLDHEAKTAIQ